MSGQKNFIQWWAKVEPRKNFILWLCITYVFIILSWNIQSSSFYSFLNNRLLFLLYRPFSSCPAPPPIPLSSASVQSWRGVCSACPPQPPPDDSVYVLHSIIIQRPSNILNEGSRGFSHNKHDTNNYKFNLACSDIHIKVKITWSSRKFRK